MASLFLAGITRPIMRRDAVAVIRTDLLKSLLLPIFFRIKYMAYNETYDQGEIMNAFDKLKARWNDDPITVLTVGALVATAAAKVIDTVTAAQGRRAYAKQVNYRVKNRK